MNKLTMNIEELAATLGISYQTLVNRRSTKPETLPPSLAIPGQKIVVWLVSDVEDWLRKCSVNYLPPAPEPKRRGRPPKSSFFP